MIVSRIVNVVPVTKAGQQTTGDVLHRPEIHGQQYDDDHERRDETSLGPRADKISSDS